VTYAVAQDNDGATWQAYNNHYWPTLYLIDKRGHLRYQHIGEGAYAEAEAAIQALLAEALSSRGLGEGAYSPLPRAAPPRPPSPLPRKRQLTVACARRIGPPRECSGVSRDQG